MIIASRSSLSAPTEAHGGLIDSCVFQWIPNLSATYTDPLIDVAFKCSICFFVSARA